MRRQPKRPRWKGEGSIPPEARTRLPSSAPLGSQCDGWSPGDPGSAPPPPTCEHRRPRLGQRARLPAALLPAGSARQVRALFRVARPRRRGSPPARTCAARRPAELAGQAPPPARGPGARRKRGPEDPHLEWVRTAGPRAGPAPSPRPAPVRPRGCLRAVRGRGNPRALGRGRCQRKDGKPGNPEDSLSTGDPWVSQSSFGRGQQA